VKSKQSIDRCVEVLLFKRDRFWTPDEAIVLCAYIKTYHQSNKSDSRFSPPSCLRMKIIDAHVKDLVPLPHGFMEFFRHQLACYLHDDPWVGAFLSCFLLLVSCYVHFSRC
jgi:hypothetical protein